MMKEARRELLKSKLKQHPKISFVYYYDNRLYCMDHLSATPMNHGAMKQHVEGKAHRINFSTGEPIVNSDIPKEVQSILELKKKTETKNEIDKFWDLKVKLDVLFPEDDDFKKYLLAEHGFDSTEKWDIKRALSNKADLKLLKDLFELRRNIAS